MRKLPISENKDFSKERNLKKEDSKTKRSDSYC